MDYTQTDTSLLLDDVSLHDWVYENTVLLGRLVELTALTRGTSRHPTPQHTTPHPDQQRAPIAHTHTLLQSYDVEYA